LRKHLSSILEHFICAYTVLGRIDIQPCSFPGINGFPVFSCIGSDHVTFISSSCISSEEGKRHKNNTTKQRVKNMYNSCSPGLLEEEEGRREGT
jgi:hypothetical protein